MPKISSPNDNLHKVEKELGNGFDEAEFKRQLEESKDGITAAYAEINSDTAKTPSSNIPCSPVPLPYSVD